MDAKPRFSFLIPAYQTEQYLRGTLDSVLSQTCGDWESIVVDNGNSDAMAAIVGEYTTDPRIKLIRHENRGYAGGVTSAAEQATGRYLCVLDSDDQLMPGFCTEVGKLLDSDPAIDAVGVDAYRFRDEGENLLVGYLRSIGVKRPDPSKRLTMADVLGGFVPYYTAAIRRETWDAVGGYNPGIPDVDESVVIWVRMVGQHDVRVLPDRLARYRLRRDSLSRDSASVEIFEEELERSFTVLPPSDPAEAAALDSTLSRIRYWKNVRRGRTAFLAGDDLTAREAAFAAFGQRRTFRSGAIVLSVLVAPALMRRVHPIKQRAVATLVHAASRISAAKRR